MRRTLVLALAALALLGVVVPDAFAQAPTPTFRINGLIDQVGSYSRNSSITDQNLSRNNDKLFYGRTRGRLDFIGEYGKTKAVVGIEIDSIWGQFGGSDNLGFGTAGTSWDLNTDTLPSIETKWVYTEFEVPLIPIPTVVRLGAQPFGSAGTYKLLFANGDFAGVNVVSTITPNVKLLFTYAAIEEMGTGKRDFPGTGTHGDDLAFIISPEVTPMKGLSIKPVYSYSYINSTTSVASRPLRGGYANGAGGPFAPAGISGADSSGTGISENRHTVGLDMRFRSGPFSLDPTILYQFGNRNSYNTVSPAYGILCNTTGTGSLNCAKDKADINAWMVDVRGGFQVGPVLLEGLFMWTSGNRAQDTLRNNVNFYQPISTDTGYLADWSGAGITALNIDYGQILATSGQNMGVGIGYDKYGRLQVGARVNYALTPTLTFYGVGNVLWTDKSVDTDGTTGNGILPAFVDRTTGRSARPEGDSKYLGTELAAGMSWKFAPGISFDVTGGYMFAGPALGHRHTTAVYCEAGKVNAANCQPPDQKDGKVNDIIITTARLRFTF